MSALEISAPVVAVVLKGYPRLSETFIAQELLALQKRGVNLQLISLRHPTDTKTHPIHDEITAPVNYMPEYLYEEPRRVLCAWHKVRGYPGYGKAKKIWLQDLKRDRTPNRIRRFGQALVLAAELPLDVTQIYAHFLHTPASVARYAAIIRGLNWSCSAHAKDIWTSPEWELQEKLDDLSWLVTCTSVNTRYLSGLASNQAKVELMYHGLDLTRFPVFDGRDFSRDGKDKSNPIRLLSVGRAVAKKGYDDLLTALAALPADLNWTFNHIGSGPLLPKLKSQAIDLGLADRIEWRGALAQKDVLLALQKADIFLLASRIAEDGDRDGLPNVLMEAQSQTLPVIATDVSAISELIIDGETGLLVPERDPVSLTSAILQLSRQPDLRVTMAEAGDKRLRDNFDAGKWIDKLSEKLGGIV